MNARLIATCVLALSASGSLLAHPPLIVVEDRGGTTSALPYYRALSLRPSSDPAEAPTIQVPQPPARGFSEADMLPVRSALLTPGDVAPRVIQAPGLAPLFLVGDDDRSHAWLRQHHAALQALGAVGLVVNVASPAGLEALRHQAPGLMLSPVSGDDLAQRLGLRHYPVLITATGIEQ